MAYSPWKICLRIGSHGIVAGRASFETFELADIQRKAMLESPSIKMQPVGSLGVLVMHYKKFKDLCESGEGVNLATLRGNEDLNPEFAAASPLSQIMGDIDTTGLDETFDLTYQDKLSNEVWSVIHAAYHDESGDELDVPLLSNVS